MEWSHFEQSINYTFHHKKLLHLAMSHSSYINEKKRDKLECNERIEFLGDAVLELVISDYLYEKFPHMPEGELTKLRASTVCEVTLAKKARALQFGQYLLLGRGEESTGGRDRDSILADAFEAVIGAVYLDGGMEIVRTYILDIMAEEVEHLKREFRTFDCKTCLQEEIQSYSQSPLLYEIVGEKGPDHDKKFMAKVSHNGVVLGVGSGRSKKEAEQSAANDALEKMKGKRTGN